MKKGKLLEYIRDCASDGKVVLETIDGLAEADLKEFVKQPAEGILYDLNRDRMTCLTLINRKGWINNYACCLVITELKKQIAELEGRLK